MQTLPNVGEAATVAGITFPLTVTGYNKETLTANLKGEHPETGMEVLVPRICMSLLHSSVNPTLSIGQFARLKSGGPIMTVVDILPPLPDMPQGAGTTVVCWHFRGNGDLLKMELDARTLNTADSSCVL